MSSVIVTSTTTRVVRRATLADVDGALGPVERAVARLGLLAITWAQSRAEARARSLDALPPAATDRARVEREREAREHASVRRIAGIRAI